MLSESYCIAYYTYLVKICEYTFNSALVSVQQFCCQLTKMAEQIFKYDINFDSLSTS